jgi:hypothetical protein
VALTACNRGNQSKDAVRQAVIDHLSTISGMNMSAMTIEIASVQFNGNQADATASISAKGVSGGGAMTIPYHLEYRSNKWVVTGRKEGGGAPHGGIPQGGAAPGAENPHGGAMPPAGAGGGTKMPSPEDLPPTKKK